MNDALVPDFVTLPEAAEEQEQEVQLQESAVAGLQHDPGWREVKEYIQGRFNLYNNPEFAQDMTDEEVGNRYRVSRQISSELQQILDYVENRYESVRDRST